MMITKEIKKQIALHLTSWMEKNDFSANEFSKKYNIPGSYISLIVNQKFEIPNGTHGTTKILDKYFKIIAEVIGYEIKSGVKWDFRPTPQALQMFSTLEDAKTFGYTNIIIGETGVGKTYVSELFVKKNPKHNIKITVGSMDNINDLLEKLCEALKVPTTSSKSKKIRNIISKLQEMKLSDASPIIIFDEAEYMRQPTLANIKELHDHLNNKVGIVLIGTDQLLTKIEKLKKKNAPGMPQFYRRIKYGIRILKAIDTRFNEFLKDIKDTNLCRFIQQQCENYGELHDVLLPSMREAERLGETLNEDLVRKVLNLPKI